MLEGKSVFVRWLALLAACAGLWLMTFVALPALRDASPFFVRMAAFVHESGIETGEFYYTDVEVCGPSSRHARATFEHTPMGGAGS